MIENYWDQEEQNNTASVVAQVEEYKFFERHIDDNELNFNFQTFQISKCLPNFVPSMESESDIMPEIGFKMLTLHLPPLVRMRDW